jgi:hypothetical protein
MSTTASKPAKGNVATATETAPRGQQTAAVRRVILIGGDKGGVGKSCVARVTNEFFENKGVPAIAYDGDSTNPTFTRFCPKAIRLDTRHVKGFEPLINNLEAPESHQIVDLGAGTSAILEQFADHTGFIDMAEQMRAKITFIFVLAPSADSIGLLKRLSEAYGQKFQYLIVRNNAIPGTWQLWEESKTRARILNELGGREITMPALDAETFSAIDKTSVSFMTAATDKRLPLALRSYVFRWQQKMFEILEAEREFLI